MSRVAWGLALMMVASGGPAVRAQPPGGASSPPITPRPAVAPSAENPLRTQPPSSPPGVSADTAAGPAATPPATPAPAVPTPPAAATAPQPQAPAPNLADELRQPRRQPSSRARGLRGETYSDVPNLVGDGNSPTSITSKVAVGRLVIQAPNLVPGADGLVGEQPAQILAVTEGQFNSVQNVLGAGYPSFTLPAQNLGPVAGTPPTRLDAGAPSGGITPVQSPGTFLAAADNAFATDPAIGTSQYADQNPTTQFDAASSGAIVGSGTTGTNVPAQDAFLYYNYLVDSTVLLPGYGVGFIKLTENMSPIPRDRIYMNYSYFANANFYPARADVNRWVPGYEMTFLDGTTSWEIRTPFAATLAAEQVLTPSSGITQYRDIEFGNMSVIFKTFLWQADTWAITGGVQTMVPTAANSTIIGTNQFGQTLEQIFVANESVHVMPFVGSVWAPNERAFSQILLQIDRDVNGNPAYVNNLQQVGISGRQLVYAGRVFYPTFMYLSFSTGYWIYKNDRARFTGFSPIMELHVNQAFGDFPPVVYDTWVLGQNPGVISVTNALIGCNFEWGKRSTLTFAYCTPLSAGLDRYFDGEFRALYNLRFGRQNRLTRAQF